MTELVSFADVVVTLGAVGVAEVVVGLVHMLYELAHPVRLVSLELDHDEPDSDVHNRMPKAA